MKISKFKPSFSDIVFITVFIITLTFGSQMLGIDSDLGRHIALGNFILDEHFVPTHDLFSHTKTGLSRPPYEWLSQVLFASAHRIMGLDGVILLTAITIAGSFTLLYKLSFRRNHSSVLTLAIVLLSMGASSLHWLPRPHIFTFLMLTVWTEMLEMLTTINKPPKLYTYFLLMLIWANMHGGFIFGILVWAAYFAGWIWDVLLDKPVKNIGKRLIMTGGVSILASFITPDLWRNWEAVLNNRSLFILARTIETMRPNLLDESVLPFTLLLLLAVLLTASTWGGIKQSHIFLLLGFGILSLAMIRNIPLFVIVSTPILSVLLAKRLLNLNRWKIIEDQFSVFGQAPKQSVWTAIITLSTMAFFIYYNLKNEQHFYKFSPILFPVDAVKFIRANPIDGNMFNQFNWGGYLLYSLWPVQHVFIDSQTDFYGEALARDYVLVESLQPGWEDVLAKYDVSWVITQNDQPLEFALTKNGWDLLYQDSAAVILLKP